MKQQTAVEWLIESIGYKHESGKTTITIHPDCDVSDLVEQAKQMEYNQMSKMYNHAMLSLLDTGHGQGFEEYYNENYNRRD